MAAIHLAGGPMSEKWMIGILVLVAFLLITTLFEIKKAQQEHNAKVDDHLRRITELLRYLGNVKG